MSKCYDHHPAPESFARVTLLGAACATLALETALTLGRIPSEHAEAVREVVNALYALTHDTDAIVLHGEF